MSIDVYAYDAERPHERLTRKQRAEKLTSGARSSVDYLTDAERELLKFIRAEGFDLQRRWLTNDRTGQTWQHAKTVLKAAPSWSHSAR